MQSTLFSLNAKDFLKGLVIAIGTPVVYLLQQLIPTWTPFLTAHLGQTGGVVAQAAISAALAYLIKNFFSDDVAAAKSTLITAAQKDGSSQVVLNVPPSTTATVTKS